MLVAVLWHCMWGRGREGAMALAPLSARFQSLPLLPTMKPGPSRADSQVHGPVHTLGPCGSLQWTLLWGWESLPLPPQPLRASPTRGPRPHSLFRFSAVPPHLSMCKCEATGSASCRTACSIRSTIRHLAAKLSWVLSTPAANLFPSYRSEWMILLYLLGCRTSMQFNFLSLLVGFFCF